ncbi:oxidoreductase [Haladaptatus sp. T7]|nr:oxidoreductase [Haladaptatus sp. T7]
MGMRNDQTLDVGVVGLGTHGLNRAQTLVDFDQRVYGSDASPDARNRFERRFGSAHFESPTELFEEDLNAVVITTPNKFHEPVATAAMKRGIDVFMEKPLAHTLASAERIADTAAETGQTCMVGFQSRFLNVCKILKWYIDRGFFGEITHVQSAYMRRRGVPGRGSWYTSKELAGGGALIDIGIHVIDLLFYFLDEPTVADVASTTRRDFGNQESYAYLDMWGEDDDANMFDVEDSASAFLEFEGDRTATMETAWAVNADSVHAYQIHGTEAGALLDITDIPNTDGEVDQTLEFFETRSGGVDHYLDTSVTANRNNPYREQIRAFLDAVAANDTPDINTVEQALAVQRLVERIYTDNE